MFINWKIFKHYYFTSESVEIAVYLQTSWFAIFSQPDVILGVININGFRKQPCGASRSGTTCLRSCNSRRMASRAKHFDTQSVSYWRLYNTFQLFLITLCRRVTNMKRHEAILNSLVHDYCRDILKMVNIWN